MKTISAISEIRRSLQPFRNDKKIGFVPTMGYLHEGHLSLIRKAKSECDIVVASIFVNPTQFAPHEDFNRYPRDIERDSLLASTAGCDILFVPTAEEMYPDGFSSYVTVEQLSSVLEGKFRPTHFKGVTTVVAKLFNIIQPGVAYFGQKDAQQFIIIKKMVNELNMPVQIVVVPTMRESDGLAMSSRNVYLNPEERKNAVVLNQSLKLAETMIRSGERNSAAVISSMRELIQSKNPTQIDYIEIVNAKTLESKSVLSGGDEILIPLAVRFGSTRLIDNIILTV
ncbi:MAG: pantoate--beta-alanine ligase [Bacteroidota bacterium]